MVIATVSDYWKQSRNLFIISVIRLRILWSSTNRIDVISFIVLIDLINIFIRLINIVIINEIRTVRPPYDCPFMVMTIQILILIQIIILQRIIVSIIDTQVVIAPSAAETDLFIRKSHQFLTGTHLIRLLQTNIIIVWALSVLMHVFRLNQVIESCSCFYRVQAYYVVVIGRLFIIIKIITIDLNCVRSTESTVFHHIQNFHFLFFYFFIF